MGDIITLSPHSVAAAVLASLSILKKCACGLTIRHGSHGTASSWMCVEVRCGEGPARWMVKPIAGLLGMTLCISFLEHAFGEIPLHLVITKRLAD